MCNFTRYICIMILPSLFISGGEIGFVVFIIIMVFGADKVPEIARGLGKGIRSVKNATNDIKTEITKTAEEHMDHGGGKDIKKEIGKVKDDIEEITGSIRRRN